MEKESQGPGHLNTLRPQGVEVRTVPDRHARCFIEVETSGFFCSLGGAAGTREGESISRGLRPVSLLWGGGGRKGLLTILQLEVS